MTTKGFEQTIQFFSAVTETGATISYPLISVNLMQASGTRVTLPLLFDTGASITTLRHELFPLLGLASWDVGASQQAQTAGRVEPATAYRYEGVSLEVFGKTFKCPVNLMQLPSNPLFVGLLGRDTIFMEFGFGFWEKTLELHVTASP